MKSKRGEYINKIWLTDIDLIIKEAFLPLPSEFLLWSR